MNNYVNFCPECFCVPLDKPESGDVKSCMSIGGDPACFNIAVYDGENWWYKHNGIDTRPKNKIEEIYALNERSRCLMEEVLNSDDLGKEVCDRLKSILSAMKLDGDELTKIINKIYGIDINDHENKKN